MNRFEHTMLRLIVLAVILIVIVHFMLPVRTEEPPEVKGDPAKMVSLVKFEGKAEMPDLDLNVDTGEPRTFELGAVAYEKPKHHRAFGARNKEVRLILAKLNGGGEDTENAVELALKYLARVQKSDGHWSDNRSIGSTGLALNAFLGAGYHHLEGEHKETVAKGLEWMLKKQNSETGNMKGENMYSDGIAGVVFCEAYGMTGDSCLREAAEKSLEYLAKSQNPDGSWDYDPYKATMGEAYDSDTSVTGWVLMAFKSAKYAGLHVPKETIYKYFEYARKVTTFKKPDNPKSKLEVGMAHYGYVKGKLQYKHFHTMTASTLMCRLYMGHTPSSPLVKEGLKIITTDLPDKYRPVWKDNGMDNYMWYHAAQVGFLASGKAWEFWNEPLREILVEHQIKDGDLKGAWPDGQFRWGDRSEVYATCLNIMILETYYRYYK